MPYSAGMARVGVAIDQWRRLDTYRQRYRIDDRLAPLDSLEKSLNRRRMRAAALTRRLEELESLLVEVRGELRAVESEIEGSRQTGALLIEEILDRVQIEMGEAWSPRPVMGYRVWRIEDNRILGNQVHWASPTMSSECLRENPGDDLPHSVDRCGPPACGIYAVKDLDAFPSSVAEGAIHNSVVGVVAMFGKVVEHEEGYRSQSATAVAVSANDGRRRLTTTDPHRINDLFDDPAGALAMAEPVGPPGENPTRPFLETALIKEEQWT